MKELYSVSVWDSRLTTFEEHYSEEEIETIYKFINDLKKYDVISRVPYIEFEKKQ